MTAHRETEWRRYLFGRNPRKTLLRVWIWTICVNLIFHSLVLPITVSGSSMAPTYESGARNLVNKLSYLRHRPERGDVVVLQLKEEGGLLIKRIIGLPGENLSIRQGHIEINGRRLVDEYADVQIPWESTTVSLGRDEFFFIGDNRANSIYGVARQNQIVGKVLF